ncbi:MAG: YceI family protein, partial [Gemmatimonadales bacterium]
GCMPQLDRWSSVRAAGLALAVVSVIAPRIVLGQAPVPIPSGVATSGVLSFDGHATLGDFTGTTTTVSGTLRGAASIDSVTGWVEAPVGTLTTGNGKRDRDLNGSMESDRFPVIRYELSSVAVRGVRGDTVDITLRGAFVIHGVRRSAEINGAAVFSPGAVEVTGAVPLDLDDFAIKGLSKMLGILKMHSGIEVHFDVTFGSMPPDPLPVPASGPPQP